MRSSFKNALPIVAMFVCLQTGLAQNMVVVNNTPGLVADYKTLQGAVDSVADGTLILLQPGPVTYGSVTVKKRVSIIGPGYFLNHNPDPYRQATPLASVVSTLTFDSASNGSYVTGISITGIINGGATRVSFSKTSNITISRCLIYQGSNGGLFSLYRSSLVTVKQSYIRCPPGSGGASILSSREATGMEFHNNVFHNDGIYSFHLPSEYFTDYNTSVLFKNNVMYNLSNPTFYPSALTFINNIIFQYNSNTTIGAVSASNNVSNANFSAPGPNINNAVEANVFVLNSDPSVTSLDKRFMLKAGSVAIGYGQGGVDCGIFGGTPNQRYELSGIAEFVPNIFYLDVPQVGTATGGIPVHIKVRANQ